MEGLLSDSPLSKQKLSPKKPMGSASHLPNKQNQVGTVMLYGIPIVSLMIESQERLCLAQISNTLLKQYSYNEIHNRRVALGITCVQCTPVQLEILRRAGAMPVSSRRCGMITRREAERLCKSFLGDNAPPRLPDDFAFSVHHECAWGCRGAFLPSRYNSSRAKCIKCAFCGLFFSPNKFIFHSHRTTSNATYVQPDAANFNSWRRHMKLSGSPPDEVVHAWEDVKAMFNGGTRKRLLAASTSGGSPHGRSSATPSASLAGSSTASKQIKMETATSTPSSYPTSSTTPLPVPTSPRLPSFSDLALPISMIDYVWHSGIGPEGIKQFSFVPYTVPWLDNAKRSVLGISTSSSPSPQQDSFFQHFSSPNQSEKLYYQSAFRPVFPILTRPDTQPVTEDHNDPFRRHVAPGDTPFPRKRHVRDGERPGPDFDIYYIGKEGDYEKCDSVAAHTRCGSVDKENDLRKGSALAVIRDFAKGSVSCDSPHGYGATCAKPTFKRLPTEPSENTQCDPPARPKGKAMDVSRFISLKTNAFDENLIKIRGFGPNLLEAISNLKTDDSNGHPGITTNAFSPPEMHDQRHLNHPLLRPSPDASRIPTASYHKHVKDTDDDKRSDSDGEEDPVDKGSPTHQSDDSGNGNSYSTIEPAYTTNGNSYNATDYNDNSNDGSVVDVETTDDPPADPVPIPLLRGNCQGRNFPAKRRNAEDMTSPGCESRRKIWTIAKFTVEEPEMRRPSAGEEPPKWRRWTRCYSSGACRGFLDSRGRPNSEVLGHFSRASGLINLPVFADFSCPNETSSCRAQHGDQQQTDSKLPGTDTCKIGGRAHCPVSFPRS